MKVGIFDHVERADRPMATTLDERLDVRRRRRRSRHLLPACRRAPRDAAQSRAGAGRLSRRGRARDQAHAARARSSICLPLYSPLRLAEEICILDHLSNGRLEVGVGRGVSPFELGYHKVAHDRSRDIFIDAFDCLNAALTQRHVQLCRQALHLCRRADGAAAAAAADAAVLVRLLEHDRRRPGRASMACISSPTARPPMPRSTSTPIARRSPSAAAPAHAEAGVPRRRGDRRAAPHRRRGNRRRGAAHRPSRNVEYHRRAASTGCARSTPRTRRTVRGSRPRGVTFEEWEKDGMAIAGSPATVLRRDRAPGRTSSASIICSRICSSARSRSSRRCARSS